MTVDLEKRGERGERAERPAPEGCLTVAIRVPVRIVVLVVVVPLRMVWDLLVLCGGFLGRVLLRPIGRAFEWLYGTVLAPVGRALARIAERVATAVLWLLKAVLYWPWLALWRYVLVPAATYGVAIPLAWLYRSVVRPVGEGLVRVLVWVCARLLVPLGRGVVTVLWAVLVWPWTVLWRYVLVPVASGAYRYVLTPLGHGLIWLVRVLVVAPAVFLYRWVLTPAGRALAALGRGLVTVGREIADAVAVAWRIAGYVSRAAGRALKWLARNAVGRPAAWCYRNVCTPVGHFVRDQVWVPARRAAVEAGRAVREALGAARETVRRARREAWRALAGGAREPDAVAPVRARERNLGGTHHAPTVPGVAPGAGISLRKQG